MSESRRIRTLQRKFALLMATAIIALSVASYAQGQASEHNDRVADHREIASLAQEVRALKTQLAKLQTRVTTDEYSLWQKQDADTSILLHTDSQGYQLLNGGEGNFLILVKSVTPYLTGYKITINVGNPMDAKFSDATFSLDWGPAYVKGSSLSEWFKNLKTKKKEATTPLYAGTWTPVTFILTPATAKDLGYLYLTMSTSEVGLSRVPGSPN